MCFSLQVLVFAEVISSSQYSCDTNYANGLISLSFGMYSSLNSMKMKCWAAGHLLMCPTFTLTISTGEKSLLLSQIVQNQLSWEMSFKDKMKEQLKDNSLYSRVIELYYLILK